MHLKFLPSLRAAGVTQSARFAIALIGAGAAVTVPASAGASTSAATPPPIDFRLPPAPTPTGTPAPQVQGPVDIDGPVPVRPRVIPTVRPPPTPTPTATQRALPTILQPQPRVAEQPQTRRFTPAARAIPGQQVSGEAFLPDETPGQMPLDMTPAAPAVGGLPTPTSLPDLANAPSVAADTGAAGGNWMSGWATWLVALAIGLLAAIGGALMLRSRRQLAPAGVATIEPPLARRRDPQPEPVKNDSPPAEKVQALVKTALPSQASQQTQQTGPISLAVAPVRLSRSMMNATLSCSITLHNSGPQTFEHLHISGDLVTAHGKVPIGEQMADHATSLPPIKKLELLPGGETGEIIASLTLPIGQIRPIRQGKATLYVPLLRLRVTGEGLEPLTRTFVIGMKPPGAAKVQPFRLDEMPQTYSQIGSRPLD